MKVLIVSCLLALSGCGTAMPLVVRPEVPPELMAPPQAWPKLKENPSLGDVAAGVVEARRRFHDNAARLEAIQSIVRESVGNDQATSKGN